jgi:hypothetical protein
VAQQPDSQSDLGFYLALAQTGLEMAAPIAVGMVLDSYLGWAPWATAAGAVIGLAGGLTHMLMILGRAEERRPTKPPRGAT